MDGGRRARLDANPLVRKNVDLLPVMIQCSVIGRIVPTGLTADPVTWFARPVGIHSVVCPECKQVHAWTKGDAHLEGPLRSASSKSSERGSHSAGPWSARIPSATRRQMTAASG
jgi:hypothetical protein